MQDSTTFRVARWVFVGIALVVATAVVVRLIGSVKLDRAQERFEAEVGSLALSDYALAPLADDLNAAVWLRRGAETLAVSEAESGVLEDLLAAEPSAVPQETAAAATAIIESNRAAIESMVRAEELTDSSFGFDYERGFDANLPPMLDLVLASKVLAADLRLAILDGNQARAARDVAVLGRLTDALAQESFLISVLMHLGVERRYLAVIHDLAQWPDAEPELLSGLRSQWLGHECTEAVRRAVAGEAAAVVDVVDRSTIHLESSRPVQGLLHWLFEPYQLAAMLDTYRGLVNGMAEPGVASAATRSESSSRVVWGYHQLMLPNLIDMIDKAEATVLSRDLAGQAIELRLLEAGLGRYPDQLEGLPVDTFAGGNVRYEVSATGEAVLEAPEAAALWRSEHYHSTPEAVTLFEWRLPAVD